MTRPAKLTYAAHSNGFSDFGFTDRKGRAVGYKWRIETVEATAPDSRCYHLLDDNLPGSFFQLTTSPTRDGLQYGPAFNSMFVATLEEAQTVIAKRTCAARNRDSKKFRKEAA